MTVSTRFHVAMLSAAVLTATASAASAAMTDEQKCLFGRNKAKSKYHHCIGMVLARYAGGAPLNILKIANCRIKYDLAWTKLATDLPGSATCAGQPRFVDNGDGTVTDNLSGLTWEKKTTAVGSGPNAADRHDVDNEYSQSTGVPYRENGTAYTDFLANLNSGGGFASATGWRLPTFAELNTILLPEPFPCTTSPCINPIFGPTISSPVGAADYASTTPDVPPLSTFTYLVDFTGFTVGSSDTTNSFAVRAVRGGF